MTKIFGITLIVLAIAIAVVPIFTDCQSQDKAITTATGKTIPMKCHWTGVAEIGISVPLFAVGAMIIANRRRDDLRNLSILGVVLGGMAIAFPFGLIGICQTPTMTCNTVMKPALTVLGSLAIISGIGGLVLSRKLMK